MVRSSGNEKRIEITYISHINFILFLKLSNDKDLDAIQGQIKELINDRDINVFPIFRSKALGEGKFENDFNWNFWNFWKMKNENG